MKIVCLSEFVTLPAGTIFSNYEPHYCSGLFRKGETISPPDGLSATDFFLASLEADYIGEHLSVDTIESRWGEFDETAQFAIYEAQDIAAIKSMLP